MYLWVLVAAVKCCSLKLCEQQLNWKVFIFYWLMHLCHTHCSFLNKFVLLMGQQAVGLDRRQPSFEPKAILHSLSSNYYLSIACNWSFSKALCVTVWRYILHCVCGRTFAHLLLSNKRPTRSLTKLFFPFLSCDQINNYRSNHLRLQKHTILSGIRVVRQQQERPAHWACGVFFWKGMLLLRNLNTENTFLFYNSGITDYAKEWSGTQLPFVCSKSNLNYK